MQAIASLRSFGASLTLVFVGALITACNDAGALGSIPANQLFGATSLTTDERKESVKSLHWRLTGLVKLRQRNPNPENVEAVIEELSECVVDNLQDRSTRLQFSMAMDTIKSGGFEGVSNLAAYRTLALSKGMDAAEFEQQAKETKRHIASAGENCMRRFVRRR